MIEVLGKNKSYQVKKDDKEYLVMGNIIYKGREGSNSMFFSR